MYKTVGTYLFFLLFGLSLQAQTVYSIDEMINFYTRNGYNIKNNCAQYQIDSLTQANNQNTFGLQSDLSFSLPYVKSIQSVTQPDGSSRLIEINYISPLAQLALRKKMIFLGGELALFSSLNGYADFINNSRQYGLSWFNLQYSQDIFGFNEYKYELKRIRLQQEKDRQTLLYSNQEDITGFVELIFQYYTNRQLLVENNKNIEKNQELLKKKRTLSKYGKALTSDTLSIYLLLNKLQIQHNDLEAKKLLAQSRIKQRALLNREFEMNVSNSPLILILDQNALSERYLKYTLQKNADLEMFELDSEIARSRKNTGVKAAVSLGMGLNSKAEDYMRNLIEGRPADKENISVSLTVPITGWESQRNRRKIAALNREIYLREQENNRQEAAFWAQDIMLRYKQSLSLIELANKNLEASRELERILLKNIESGKSDYVALYQLYVDNQSILSDKYNAIRDIYILKYNLIQTTFFDFEKNISLTH